MCLLFFMVTLLQRGSYTGYGSLYFAGTLNGEGCLKVRATKKPDVFGPACMAKVKKVLF